MGYNVFAGWGEESAWATPVARTQFGRPYDDTKMNHEIPRNPVANLGDRDPAQVFDGVEKGTANISVPLVYDGCGKLLKHCFGAVVDAGPGPYTHTFTLDETPYTRAASPLIGLTVESHQDMPDASLESFLLYGGRVRSFGLSLKVGEEIKLVADLVGQRVIQAIKTASPTYPDYDNDRIIPRQITVAFDGGGASDIYGIDIDVNNSLRDDKGALGSQYIVAPNARAKRAVTGSIEKEWTIKTLYDKFLSGAAASVIATCTGAGNNLFVITLANIRYTGETPSITEGEDNDQMLPFLALKDVTNTALKIVETNDTATT